MELLGAAPSHRPQIDAWHREVSGLLQSLVTSRLSSDDMASILAGLASFRSTGVTPEKTQLSLVKAYCQSSGLFQELLHHIFFGQAVASAPRRDSEFFGHIDGNSIAKILSELDETGYCVLPFRLGRDIVDAVKRNSLSIGYSLRERLDESVPKAIPSIDPAAPPSCVAAYANNGQVLADPLLKSIAEDPLILHLAASHLKTEAIPIDATLWYSFPSKSPSSESAQLFHFDLDTLRWLKVFYYLTDVNTESGPHLYIKGTHKPGVKDAELLKKGYARILDSEMESAHPGKKVSITGPAGTVILGDTRCFHKGTHLKSGHRLIFSPIYAPSKIGYFHGSRGPGESVPAR